MPTRGGARGGATTTTVVPRKIATETGIGTETGNVTVPPAVTGARGREMERRKRGIRIERGGIRIRIRTRIRTRIGIGEIVIRIRKRSAREERGIGSERRERDPEGVGVAPRETETGSEISKCAMDGNSYILCFLQLACELGFTF